MEQRGQGILCEIDKRAQKARGNIVRLNEQTQKLMLQIEEIQKEEAHLYLKLASVKSQKHNEENLEDIISHAEREAFRLLQKRDANLNALDKEAKILRDAIEREENGRACCNEEAAKLRIEQKQLRTKTIEKLKNDDEYIALNKKVEEIEAQIERVRYKIPLIQEDQEEKMRSYHEDILFMHLWDVGYGTSTYRKNFISRGFDRWVARILKFEDARRNYSVLSALPRKFIDHLTLLEAKLDRFEEAISKYVQELVLENGGNKLNTKRIELQKQLDIYDERISEFEQEFQSLQQKRHEIIVGQDDLSREAQTYLDHFLKNKSLSQLKREAAASASPEDDALILSLYEIDTMKSDIQSRLSDYQSLILQEEKRLIDIQSVRSTYKERRYDQSTETVESSNFFMLLGQMLNRVITSEAFWRVVGSVFEEILDEFDLDDIIDFDDDRRRKYHKKSYRGNRKRRKRKRRYRYDD